MGPGTQVTDLATRPLPTVSVLVEELHPRRLEVKFKFAGRDPDCLQESLVVLCEQLTLNVQFSSRDTYCSQESLFVLSKNLTSIVPH